MLSGGVTKRGGVLLHVCDLLNYSVDVWQSCWEVSWSHGTTLN